ncbi:TPA: potassium transporter Kup [Acinetobacter baumannii]|jgi:KUP system potassium uptake protein|uniref:Probable potassium transport system protein Kup n=37 Tax=Gammaproteobacteria TaxID=1236 RepID=KUP_ACIBC|nr:MULTISPECIES: potassium transporter Kup [Acinetobacter]A3M9P9.2 RecName: Full=Probable potassium transport system protein Kup [Acinetobacter baumannii ATCC 17978]B2I0Q1.1 RecName: Full=Probable potassium transport system protein Kup [Acinetobacter baumannii ACICU]ADX94080.1 K+ transporter [Acinetobacter baumannii TCDC-AB0715]AHX28836.1 potassium transporter Kup [Acinetobacter baumannii AC12]AHX64302.1 potassium transporter Kup [Acinetobacter baumannii AC30]EMT93073.1 K+ transporter [Acinet
MQNTAKKATLPATALAALGVVFGDIGTSPLYALKESFHAAHGLGIQPENVLGILSIIFWCLMLIISIKYVAIVMRADNNGEGGIMALLALNLRKAKIADNKKIYMIAIGFIGASLFFGDGIITPAISVLSAVEGLSIATDVFDPFIMPIAIAIIVTLFLVQKHGTAFVGKFFGPITLVWFLSLGILGIHSVIQTPVVLGMFSPHWAIQFIYHHPIMTFFVMGAVVLTVTGGEALYADMGHFGPVPIRLAWFFVVLPCLVLNYAGQGALLLRDPAAIENPFYLLVPQWALYPMIIMATMATVIASQAVISGVFSLARQAIQLGYLPRLSIKHTSESEEGQIYVPFLNWLLLIAIIILILIFKTSSNLASAYGLAVTLTMLCDTILVAVFIYSAWKWSLPKVLLLIIPFFILESVLVGATSLKILSGGWVPLLIGAIAVTILMTWKRGRELTFAKLEHDTLSLDLFVKSIGNSVHWVPGDAVFMTGTPNVVPHAMLHNIKHNKVLHQRNILVTVVIEDVPFVAPEERITTETLAEHFFRIKIFYGFKDEMNVPKALMQAYEQLGLEYDLMHISFFISRDRIVHSVGDGMSPWREKLFISMQRNTSPVSDFYQIPTNRVVELGSQIEI